MKKILLFAMTIVFMSLPSYAADTDCDDDVNGYVDVDCGGTNAATAAAIYFFGGPTAGDAAAPSFRGLETTDIPDLSATYQTVLGAGDITTTMLEGPAKWVSEDIAANTDPFAITPTGGWTAYHVFYLYVTQTTDGGDISLTETGPPANGTIAVIINEGANTVEIPNSDGNLEIPNDGTIVLEANESYPVIYDTDRWRPLNDRRTLTYATLTTVETEFIPVGYMIDGASAPDALATLTSGTDKANTRTFAGDADEDLVFDWQVPLDLDTTSGIKFRVICIISSATGPSAETWQFELQGFTLGDGDALDGTLGTAQTSNSGERTDAQYDRVATAWSAAMTSTHITNLAVGETAQFKLYRDVDDSDTYAQNVAVVGIEFKYKRFHNATF